MRNLTNHHVTGPLTALFIAAAPAGIAQTTPDPATTPLPETGAPAAAATLENGADAATEFMDQSEIEDNLEDRGYSEINLQVEDNRYVGTATWYGEKVDLEVNANNGRVLQPSRLTAEQIAYKLEQEDYENVSDVREAGREFTATAERFGEEMDLRVSASSGNVLDPRELSTDQLRERLEEDDYRDIIIFQRRDDYGNYRAIAELDGATYLLEVQPVSGEILDEREES